MVNMNDLLNKINNKGIAMYNAQRVETDRKIQELLKMEETIRKLLPRVQDLRKLVHALGGNKIDNRRFFTNGIHREIGFYSSQNVLRDKFCFPNSFFGIANNGLKGSDLYINIETGIITYGNKIDLETKLDNHCMQQISKVIKDFNDYEQKLIEYIERL